MILIRQSVHGAALTEEGNQYVPTCIDCHGVHNIQNPNDSFLSQQYPALCAKCHTNETLMKQFGISTNVLNTYVADFHGTTVQMFEKNYPGSTNEQTCLYRLSWGSRYYETGNPQAGIAFKKNLLVKCQQCHPNATTNTFTDAWLSHYEPSPQVFPLVYFVNLFYKIFIPAVLGGMLVFVLSDVYRRFIARGTTGKRSDARMSDTVTRTYERFPLARRIEHLIMLLSFTTLGAYRSAAKVSRG